METLLRCWILKPLYGQVKTITQTLQSNIDNVCKERIQLELLTRGRTLNTGRDFREETFIPRSKKISVLQCHINKENGEFQIKMGADSSFHLVHTSSYAGLN